MMFQDNDQPITVTMEITEFMFEQLREVLDLDTELEKGSVTNMPDGRLSFTIEVDGDKKQLIIEFMNILIQKPSDQVQVKILGHEVNPN